MFSFDFHDKLLIVTIGPIAGVMLLGITYVIAASKHRHSKTALGNIWHKHVSMVLLVTFLVYSSISSTVFQMFACEVLDDGSNYLRADYRINCDSTKHKELQIYAGFMIVLYPVGIPLLYAGLLFRDRTVLRKAAERNVLSKVKPTSDLWKPYKPSRFYYEIIDSADLARGCYSVHIPQHRGTGRGYDRRCVHFCHALGSAGPVQCRVRLLDKPYGARGGFHEHVHSSSFEDRCIQRAHQQPETIGVGACSCTHLHGVGCDSRGRDYGTFRSNT